MRALWVAIVSMFLLSSCSFLFTPTDEEKPLSDPNKTASAVDDSPKSKRKRLIVLPFLNKSRHGGDELAIHARDIVYASLVGSQDYQLVPNAEVEGAEQFINDLGEYDFRKIYDKARGFNISGIVGGVIEDITIRETGDETGLFRSKQFAVGAKLRLKLFDANTERELMSRVTSADVTEERTEFFNTRKITNYDPERGKVAVQKALEKVVGIIPNYARKIAWAGRIAKVDMHRYYITAGETSGIPKGQLLKVFDDGQPIFDPDTRLLVGIAPGRFKGLLKVVDHFGEDGSVAIVHSGGGFKERDRVEIFSQLQNR